MKKLFLLACLITTLTHATQWLGLVTPGDYVDQDIDIKGDCYLDQGLTTVWARNQDVFIQVSNTSKVYGSSAGQSTLILRTTYPYKITIIIDHSLTFLGAEGQLNLPLIVSEQADYDQYTAGTVAWIVAEGKKLTFGSGDNHGGTHLKIEIYNNGGNIIIPTHTFTPKTYSSQIIFARHSRLVYSYFWAPWQIEGNTFKGLLFNCFEANDDHHTLLELQENPLFNFVQLPIT